MKFKLLTLTIMLSILFSTTAFANVNPKIVTSTDREICLDIPQGKFADGVYMVPVRRICEIFNASCDWYGDKRMIVINSADNYTRIFLYIESDTFRIFTFTGPITGNAQDLTLEAPLEIVNDRTLVPFEQICKALNGEVIWSEDKSVVTVISNEKEFEQKAEIALVAESKDVSCGDEIEILVVAKNTDVNENFGLSGYSAGIIYDKTQFEYVSSALVGNVDKEIKYVKAENIAYTKDSSKVVCVTTELFDYDSSEVKIGKIVLRALTDNGGEIRLSNRVYTAGDDTMLVYTEKEGQSIDALHRGSMLKIDTTPLIFN